MRSKTFLGCLVLVGCAVVSLAIAGCGSSSTKASKLSISISDKGKTASFTVPKSAKGGLVDLTVKNAGKAPHGVQFVQYTGNHAAADVLKQLGSNSNKTPAWLRGQGGTPPVAPGQTGTATLNLDPGNYVLVDSAALGPTSSGPPANTTMKITSGSTGSLPSTSATVTADAPAKDKYSWSISGLKAGNNEITFNSKGNDALHLIAAVPVKGKVPPLAKIKSDFAKQGPPPPYLDPSKFQTSAVLDGGKSQTLSLDLKKGTYVFFCPLTDRDGGKPHDQEGLLKTVTIK